MSADQRDAYMMSPPPDETTRKPALTAGFTLIELSVVLVIIGLIVGGILTGRDLIHAAEIRATISQIEKYNTAVNTFRAMYDYLPGDIPDPTASRLGFQARGPLPGQGDGNGVIEGLYWPTNVTQGYDEIEGETSTFWVDLSTAGLIDGSFSAASISTHPNTNPIVNTWFPAAKIGQGNYVYVWSGGPQAVGGQGGNGINYYGLSVVTGFDWTGVTSSPGLTVQQAYSIDVKIDDGLPQSGHVIAMYLYDPGQKWAAGGGNAGACAGLPCLPTTTVTPGSATTCYDNGNSAGAAQQYSMDQNAGTGVNCALSFEFQ